MENDRRQRGGHAHQKIKNEVAEMPHAVFDVVAEYYEKPHVAYDMRPPAMHKHGSEDRLHLPDAEILDKSKRDESVRFYQLFQLTLAQAHLEKKNKRIQNH